jgi:hypothetical protein
MRNTLILKIKRMKTKILLISLLVISLSSCKESFLEIPSKTSLSTPIFFKTQKDFEQAINGVYSPLRSLYSNAWAMGEVRSDNSCYAYNPNDRGTIQPEAIADFTELPDNGVVSGKYVNDYSIIARANQVLDPIDAVSFDKTVKDNLKGQALFLRAFAYFDLVQYFGSIPLHLKPATTLEETALPLTGVDQIYQQIITDTQTASTLLPKKSVQEAGRATSGTAKTMLGNVYVVLKQWDNAVSILKEVVSSGDYTLVSNYAEVFNPNAKNNSESIFEIQYKEGTDGFASNFIYQFLPQPITPAEITAVTGVAKVQARTIEGYNIPTPDIIADYEAGDLRKDATIGNCVANNIPFPYVKKYNHSHQQDGLTNDNWPVYRYSEVLLLLAEALNETGKTSEAIPYVNQVRTRAGLSNIGSLSQVELRQAILHERRIELAFENKRWLDLVRTGNAESVMKAYGARVIANPQAYYFPLGIKPIPAAFTKINTTFALPSSEASLSPYF